MTQAEQILRELKDKGRATIPKGSSLETFDAVLGGLHQPMTDSHAKSITKTSSSPSRTNMRQLFRLSTSIIDSMSTEEVQATLADMQELGIAKPPYDVYSIEAPIGRVFKLYEQGSGQEVPIPANQMERSAIYHIDHIQNSIGLEIPSFNEHCAIPNVHKYLKQIAKEGIVNQSDIMTVTESMPLAAERLEQLLIVLLATKNVVKEVTHNRLAKFGVGKQKAEYTTTLKIGKITEDASVPGEPTGTTRRPHLRRGHIRRQHYGPENSYVKQIFIQPCFVNADEGWINSRTAYNVSK